MSPHNIARKKKGTKWPFHQILWSSRTPVQSKWQGGLRSWNQDTTFDHIWTPSLLCYILGQGFYLFQPQFFSLGKWAWYYRAYWITVGRKWCHTHKASRLESAPESLIKCCCKSSWEMNEEGMNGPQACLLQMLPEVGNGHALRTSEIKLLVSRMMKQFNAWVHLCLRKKRTIKLKMMRELMISPEGIRGIGSLWSLERILGTGMPFAGMLRTL